MNMPIIFWIGIVGGFAIGFVVGAHLGHEKGLSRDIQQIKYAERLTRVLE